MEKVNSESSYILVPGTKQCWSLEDCSRIKQLRPCPHCLHPTQRERLVSCCWVVVQEEENGGKLRSFSVCYEETIISHPTLSASTLNGDRSAPHRQKKWKMRVNSCKVGKSWGEHSSCPCPLHWPTSSSSSRHDFQRIPSRLPLTCS